MARVERNEFDDSSTVSGTINDRASSILLSYYNTSLVEDIGDGIEYNPHNVIYDYIDELQSMCHTVLLSDIEYIRYEFRPDLLSYDIYGTIDYDFVILALNGMLSPKEFIKKKIKMIPVEEMSDILNSIYNAEQSYLMKNRYE